MPAQKSFSRPRAKPPRKAATTRSTRLAQMHRRILELGSRGSARDDSAALREVTGFFYEAARLGNTGIP